MQSGLHHKPAESSYPQKEHGAEVHPFLKFPDHTSTSARPACPMLNEIQNSLSPYHLYKGVSPCAAVYHPHGSDIGSNPKKPPCPWLHLQSYQRYRTILR